MDRGSSEAKRKLALLIEYDGTGYSGFQYQPGRPTIQGEIERALERLTGKEIRIRGASRTDAGVHAKGQVISFCTDASHPINTFVSGTNFYLPEDVRVQKAWEVEEGFDPRRSAVSREYHYSILTASAPSPLMRRIAYYIPQPLDLEAMGEAAEALVGTHDFAPFSSVMQGSGGSTVRDVHRVGFEYTGPLLVFKMEANAFLRQQVRRTVGALLQVGLGKTSVGDFQSMLVDDGYGVAGPTLPAQGLCLMQVKYSDFVE